MIVKIPHSVRRHYEQKVFVYRAMQGEVDAIVRDCIYDKWLYFSRIKTCESFYEKMQQGRSDALYEDILAATVVVENANQVEEARNILQEQFSLVGQRPERIDKTRKRPDSFPFDDLRMYLKLKKRAVTSENAECIFEIQVKTFLQHAWTIATHDLIYKAAQVQSWSMFRVAYQIKAMLEHVEASVANASALSDSPSLKITTDECDERRVIASQLGKWGFDLKETSQRIVQNVQSVLRRFDVGWADVVQWVNVENGKGEGHGCRQLRFSPYEIVLDAILLHCTTALEHYRAMLEKKHLGKLIVPDEFVEIHPDVSDCMENIGQFN